MTQSRKRKLTKPTEENADSTSRAARLRRIAAYLPDDPLVHEHTRMRILTVLAAIDRISFVELRSLISVDDGALSSHIQRLEAAGLVRSKKSFLNRIPRTEIRMTAKGDRRYRRHLGGLIALIAAARGQ